MSQFQDGLQLYDTFVFNYALMNQLCCMKLFPSFQ